MNIAPLAIGRTLSIQGYEFRVVRSWVVTTESGATVHNFVGECTDDTVNDSIRHTGYNGGTYSHPVELDNNDDAIEHVVAFEVAAYRKRLATLGRYDLIK